MPLSPWLTFRQAREALRAGQPDEARRLVAPFVVEGYRKAIKLNREIARTYISRGERHLRADNAESAWQELLAAESLNTGEDAAVKLRHTLTRLALAECRAALEAGHPVHVIDAAARLRDRRAVSAELDVLEEAAQDWVLASEQADRGDFLLAKGTLAHARTKLTLPTAAGLDRVADELDRRHERFRMAVGHLNEAADARQWEEVVRRADEVVAVAGNHREARSLRAKAWEALQPEAHLSPALGGDGQGGVGLTKARGEGVSSVLLLAQPDHANSFGETRTWQPDPAERKRFSTHPYVGTTLDDGLLLPKRFLLWVDGIGGYLVCLGTRVTLGQATADGPVDVPLFADVSRLHAELTRDAEGYILESGREVLVNGQLTKRSVLAPGDRVTLGATCQLQFHRPVPISPTAKLELVSGHRLPLAVDGVLLMAESLILGPAGRSHIVLADLPGPVVVYRSKDGLGVKYDGPFTVDGRPCEGRSPLSLPSVVTAEAFTFAVEPVGARL